MDRPTVVEALVGPHHQRDQLLAGKVLLPEPRREVRGGMRAERAPVVIEHALLDAELVEVRVGVGHRDGELRVVDRQLQRQADGVLGFLLRLAGKPDHEVTENLEPVLAGLSHHDAHLLHRICLLIAWSTASLPDSTPYWMRT